VYISYGINIVIGTKIRDVVVDFLSLREYVKYGVALAESSARYNENLEWLNRTL